ncbi:hypothetical protein ACLOJK_015501 [Asimina triloba]
MASSGSLDLREEYANAFRTESYDEFWARVLDLTAPSDAAATSTSTAAARLPSYRLFAEHLLDPDQPTVAKTLALSQPRNRPENHALLADYFSETAAASLLCILLLKDIEQTRLIYRPLRTTTLRTPQPSPAANCPSSSFADHLAAFSNCPNPFCPTAASPIRFQAMQARCAGLLKRLESRREKVQSHLRCLAGLKRGLSVFVVALAASAAAVAVVVAAHACLLFVTMPAVFPGCVRVGGRRRATARAWAQVDAAAKGMYIVSKDLETIGRMVERVEEEVEHARRMVRFWGERSRREEEMMVGAEVVKEVWKNEASFLGQLDDLEEHLYLCLMTINRARNLVMEEILKKG